MNIKFRCWGRFGEWDNETELNEFIMVDAHDLAFEEYMPLWEQLRDIDDQQYFLQFTGRFDKDGKELFKGDIVRVDYDYTGNEWSDDCGDSGYWIGSIIYQPSKGFLAKAAYQYSEDGDEAWKIKGYRNFASCRAKVVGNVFQDKELLEVPR